MIIDIKNEKNDYMENLGIIKNYNPHIHTFISPKHVFLLPAVGGAQHSNSFLNKEKKTARLQQNLSRRAGELRVSEPNRSSHCPSQQAGPEPLARTFQQEMC